MLPEAQYRQAAETLYKEARCLDEGRWDDWLAMYAEDAIFWVPTWKEDGAPASDPYGELSLIYCNSRSQLKERTDRVAGGRSIASTPLMRTAHTVSNVLVDHAAEGGGFDVKSAAATHVFNVKTREQNVFFCLQEHYLVPAGAGVLQIKRKKLLLLNDYIPRMIDFYVI